MSLVAWVVRGRRGLAGRCDRDRGDRGHERRPRLLCRRPRPENAVAALARMTAVTSAVVRDGRLERVPSAELVRGDLLVLGEGDAVGADARLVQAAALRVQEASLTGESEAVLKDAATLPAHRRRSAIGSTWSSRAPPSCRARGRAVVTAIGHGDGDGLDRRHAGGDRRRSRPRCRRRWRGSARMLGIAVVVIAVVGRGDGAADLRHSHRRRRRSRSCCSACRWRWPPCPKGCRRSCRSCSPSACSGWRARNAIVKKLVLGGDAGLGVRHLLGQDRHAHPLGDDHRAGHDRVGRRRASPVSATRPRVGSSTRATSSASGPLLGREHRRAQRRQPGRQRRPARDGGRRLGDPGRSDRGGLPGGRAQARPRRAAQAALRSHSRDPVHAPSAR